MAKLLKFDQSFGDIKKGQIPRIIMVYGADFGLNYSRISFFAEEIKKLHGDFQIQNYTESDLNRDFSIFEQSVCHASLFGNATIGRVRLHNDSANNELIELIESLDKDNIIISGAILIAAADIAPSNKLVQAIEKSKHCWVLRQYPMENEELSGFVKSRATLAGIDISSQTIDYFLKNCANDHDAIIGDFENLALYVGKGKTITEADIDAIKSTDKETTIEEIIDLTLLGNLQQLIIKLAAIDNDEINIILLNTIFRRLRLLLSIHAEAQNGRSFNDIVKDKKFGVFWKSQRNVARQCTLWPRVKIEGALSQIIKCDASCKQREAPVHMIIEALLMALGRSALRIN